MVRVVRRGASASARACPSRVTQRKARKHKVIMESVTRAKKKLRSVICFEARAPCGYTFIPAGTPLLTSTCKERCRNQGLQVYAVSTTPHATTHNLSQHVHRIGYHFPSTVVAAACTELGLYLTSAGKAVPFHTLGALQSQPPSELEASQITINTEARDAIKDLFPNIPQDDLFQIIKTAFQKGQRKVGTATELPLARRAQLAVVAHIRHLYTDYDRLLKVKSFHEARSAVEQSTLAKVVAWRGDDENGQTVLEDVFREVIVISDDDDSETEAKERVLSADARDQDGETLFENTRAHDIHAFPVNFAELSHQDSLRDLSEGPTAEFQVVSTIPAKKSIDRRGFSRYQAWNRALTRYRIGAQNTTDPTGLDDASAEQQMPKSPKQPRLGQNLESIRRNDGVLTHTDSMTGFPQQSQYPIQPAQKVPVTLATHELTDSNLLAAQKIAFPVDDRRECSPHRSDGRPLALAQAKAADARLFEEPSRSGTKDLGFQAIGTRRANALPNHALAPANEQAAVPVFVRGPKELPPRSEAQIELVNRAPFPPRSKPAVISHDHVLPSVEIPRSFENRSVEGHLERLTERMSLRSTTPVRRTIQHDSLNATGSVVDQNPKRRRLGYDAASYDDNRLVAHNVDVARYPFRDGLMPRGKHSRKEPVLELRSPDRAYLDRDYAPASDSLFRAGNYRKRQAIRPIPSQADAKRPQPVSDQWHGADPFPRPIMHHGQPRQPEASSSHILSGYPSRATGVSCPNLPFAHRSDRSSFMERPRPALLDGSSHAIPWEPPSEGRNNNATTSSQRLYADDFVRHVDTREVHPVPWYVQRSRPHVQHVEGPSNQDSSPLGYAPSQAQHPSLERCQSPTSRGTALNSLHGASIQTGPVSAGQQGNHSFRPQRLDSESTRLRPIRDPQPFRVREQDRPVYVQRVEPRPSSYAVPDGKDVVIVD